MKLQENGFFDNETAAKSGLPIFDISEDENYPNINSWTYTDLKKIGISLTMEEREEMLIGFIRTSKKQKGYSGLYSLVEIINKKYNMNARFYPSE